MDSRWDLVVIAGVLLLIVLCYVLVSRWREKRAKDDEEDFVEQMVANIHVIYNQDDEPPERPIGV